MKRIGMTAMLVLGLVGGSLRYAQDTAGDNQAAINAQRMMLARQRAMGRPMGMPPAITKEKINQSLQILFELGLLYKMMGQPSMVSTDDGIIVAYGNTLRKYDKELNVVKVVQLDVDTDAVQNLASKLAEKYTSKLMDLTGGLPGSPVSATGTSAGTSAVAPASTAASYPAKNFDDQKEELIKKEIDQLK